MSKRIFSFGIVCVLAIACLGVFIGCNQKADTTLSDYKLEAKSALEDYAQERKDDYCADNWTTISDIIDEGKAAIDAAESMPAVDIAVNDAKDAIEWVQKEDEMIDIESQFDLSDPKEPEILRIYDEFAIDRVVIIMKKTTTYPELELRHFGLSNCMSLEYNWFRPSSENTPYFRQILTIYLKEHGKEKVVEAINELEKLAFVKVAHPDYIYGTQNC